MTIHTLKLIDDLLCSEIARSRSLLHESKEAVSKDPTNNSLLVDLRCYDLRVAKAHNALDEFRSHDFH